MIGKLTGLMDYIAADHALIDVRGVGYIVYVSDRTRMSLPRAGEPVSLYTDMLVREDNMQLFGFTSLFEKEWYRLLISVQGIGAKAAMAILGTLSPEVLGRSIALGDWNAIKAAPGVGPKTAQRVVMELKDKAPSVMAKGGSLPETLDASDAAEVIEANEAPKASKTKAAVKPAKAGNAAAEAEAHSALQNLGYSPSDAAQSVAQAANDAPDADTSTLIRAALKLLAPKE